jgi:hypothetical protein
MATAIYTYTGTGNALWAARRIAEGLGEAEVRAIPGPVSEERDVIGLIFPVYMWGPPTPVVDFIHQLPQDTFGYIFAVAVNAGEPGRTLLMVETCPQIPETDTVGGMGASHSVELHPMGRSRNAGRAGHPIQQCREKNPGHRRGRKPAHNAGAGTRWVERQCQELSFP